MNDSLNANQSPLPMNGLRLFLGAIATVVFGWFLGFTNLIFLIIFIVLFLCALSWVIALSKWFKMDQTTRPMMVFPKQAVGITVGVFAVLVPIFVWVWNEIADAFQAFGG